MPMKRGRPTKTGVRTTIRIDEDNLMWLRAVTRPRSDEQNELINQALRWHLGLDGVTDGKVQRQRALELKLKGMTYAQVGAALGVSHQRAQYLLRPPEVICKLVIERANSKCQDCRVTVLVSGHIHHVDPMREDFNHPDNLAYLCASCHTKRHVAETN